jgi:hypothetical protein
LTPLPPFEVKEKTGDMVWALFLYRNQPGDNNRGLFGLEIG